MRHETWPALQASATVAAPPLGEATLHDASRRLGFTLPAGHAAFLRRANGIAIFGGYLRLMGLGPGPMIDMEWWNREETWKFAWDGAARDYLCFAETAWGDQFAYDMEALRRGEVVIVDLDAIGMNPTPFESSFDGFLDRFASWGRSGGEALTVEARKRLGDLRSDEHVVQVPSLLITGEESIELVVKMDAASAMIANGDVSTQIASFGEASLVTGIEPYIDDRGRSRLRLLTEPG